MSSDKSGFRGTGGFISTFSILKGKRALYAFFAMLLLFLGFRLLHINIGIGVPEDCDFSEYCRPNCVYKGSIENNQSLFTALTGAGISPVYVDEIRIAL
jgi:hypothetical protein